MTIVAEVSTQGEATKQMNSAELTSTDIEWHDGVLFSKHYQDRYFSKHDAIEEARYVFLQHNGLPQRWGPRSKFCMVETGFGTGLNFLVCAQEFMRSEAQHLHYIAVEKHPLPKHQLIEALASFPELFTKDFSATTTLLIKNYPEQVTKQGLQQFDCGKIKLELYFCDLTDMLKQLKRPVDAWLLDGFTPAKNPSMWRYPLYRHMAALTRPGGTFSTYTASGSVRRGLEQVGFVVKKTTGHGNKRHMLQGLMPVSTTKTKATVSPWFIPPSPCLLSSHKQQQALIIGAGLAGVTSAVALAKRGWQVTILEQRARPAQEASGNPCAIFAPKLSAYLGDGKEINRDSAACFYRQAFYFALDFIKSIKQSNNFFHNCGVLYLLSNTQQENKLNSLEHELARWVNPQQASQLSGLPLSQAGLFFAQAGWMQPKAYCQALLKHYAKYITLHTNCRVDHLAPGACGLDSEGWAAFDVNNQLLGQGPALIIANNLGSNLFPQTAHLPLMSVRGQISLAPSTEVSQALKTVVCEKGYLIPAYQQQHALGATYDRHDNDQTVRMVDHRRNIEKIAHWAHSLQLIKQLDQFTGRTGFRCFSKDYLPIVGPAPIASSFQQSYAILGKGATPYGLPPAPCYPGLYLNTGHGSRGLLSTPLAGEMLAALICGGKPAVSQSLAHALHPARFIIYDLKHSHK